MKQHDSEMWRKFTTTAAADLASATLLTAYGSGDEGNNAGGKTDRGSATKMTKTGGSAPAASKDRLLLTNEIQGAGFSESKITGFKDAMGMFSEDSTKFRPAECATFTNSTKGLENVAGAYADIKEKNITVSVSVLRDPKAYQKYEDNLEKCSDVTATMDASNILKDSMEGQEISPEIQGMLNNVDMAATMRLHREEWGPDLSIKPTEFATCETSANINTNDTDTTAASYDIIGIVGGIMVMVSTAPAPDAPAGNVENTADPMQIPEAISKSKEAAKKRTLDVSNAQAKRIMDAAQSFFLAYCFLEP